MGKKRDQKEVLRQTAEQMSSFGDETRIGIINFLLTGEKNVGDIAAAVGIPVVNASHHLNKLKSTGVLKDRKEGRFVMYSLNPELVNKTGNKTTLKMGLCYVSFEG